MLSFSKLTKNDKLKRYQTAGTFLVVASCLMGPWNGTYYHGFIYVLCMILDLFFLGFLDKKPQYDSKQFLLDTSLLLCTAGFTTFFLTARVVRFLQLPDVHLFGRTSKGLTEFLVSLILIRFLWYAYLFLQQKLTQKSVY